MNTMYLSIGNATCFLRIHEASVYDFFCSVYAKGAIRRTTRPCVTIDIITGELGTSIDGPNKRVMISFPQKITDYAVLFDMIRGAISQFLPFVDTILLHASVVVIKKKAYIFSGDVGVGKTTIMTLLSDYQSYGDDTAVISLRNGTVLAFPSPLYETSKCVYTGSRVPIAGIYFISHHKDNVVTRMPMSKAYMHVVKNLKHYLIKPYTIKKQGLASFQAKDAIAITSISEKVARHVPCYSLQFTNKNLAFLDLLLIHSNT